MIVGPEMVLVSRQSARRWQPQTRH